MDVRRSLLRKTKINYNRKSAGGCAPHTAGLRQRIYGKSAAASTNIKGERMAEQRASRMRQKQKKSKKWIAPVILLILAVLAALLMLKYCAPVSYTHLDVYKRQLYAQGNGPYG